MTFDKILQYQTIDAELFTLENEVSKSKERMALVQAKKTIDDATAQINTLSGEAASILKNYDAMLAKINSLKKKIDEFDGIVEGIADSSEADYYIKQISAISEEIYTIEKELNKDSSHIEDVNSKYQVTWDNGTKASSQYRTAKAAYEELLKKCQPRVQQLTLQLNALKADIPAEFMSHYLAARAAKKLPAFVEYEPDSKRCGRCYKELAAVTYDKLKKPGDWVECPECRRILFIAD